MKNLTIILLLLFKLASVYAQPKDIDSLKILLRSETTDSVRINLLLAAGNSFGYGFKKNDSAFFYLQEALNLSNKIDDKRGSNRAKWAMSRYFRINGNFKEALELSFQNLKFAKDTKDTNSIFLTLKEFMKTYRNMDDYPQVLVYAKQYKEVLDVSSFAKLGNASMYPFAYNNNVSVAYDGLGMMDSALFYSLVNYNLYKDVGLEEALLASINLAQVYAGMGRDDSASYLFRKCLTLTGKTKRNDIISIAKLGLAKYFYKKGITDSAYFYARQALNELQVMDDQESVLETYSLLVKLNRDNHHFDSAYKYLQLYTTINDSLYSNKKIVQAQSFAYAASMEQEKLEQAKKEAKQQYRAAIKLYILAAIIAAFSIIAFLLFRNLRNKRKANTLLNKQKEEIQSALLNLKATQSQLIHSEKMASLGELTAGIAHEIQNPLNFVNNFSDVNTELIDEAEQEIDKGNISEAKSILSDIKENEEKINHHGKRADAIVKGMLQHSQSSKGQKEPTDINALCDEYLRLSYHGLRAKDKNFNATLKTDFDNSIGKINIIPQDIGRVILNLITNAFYAVDEKKTLRQACLSGRQAQGDNSYEPTVYVKTSQTAPSPNLSVQAGGRGVIISVTDNGNGIPASIKDKIFQPFFTTKPTGQGTGLGLSLAYDIVNAHGGEIKVESKDGEGTTFIIQLHV